jgi:hypothetical protein
MKAFIVVLVILIFVIGCSKSGEEIIELRNIERPSILGIVPGEPLPKDVGIWGFRKEDDGSYSAHVEQKTLPELSFKYYAYLKFGGDNPKAPVSEIKLVCDPENTDKLIDLVENKFGKLHFNPKKIEYEGRKQTIQRADVWLNKDVYLILIHSAERCWVYLSSSSAEKLLPEKSKITDKKNF